MTPTQIIAIIMLLQAFGVSQSTINLVQADLTPQQAPQTTQEAPSETQTFVSTLGVSQATTTSQEGTLEVLDIDNPADFMEAPHTAAAAGTTWDAAEDGQYIAVGVIPLNPDGTMANYTGTIEASTTDSSQNKTLTDLEKFCQVRGATIHDDNLSEPCYPYRFVFHDTNPQTIEFVWGDVTGTITVQAQ